MPPEVDLTRKEKCSCGNCIRGIALGFWENTHFYTRHDTKSIHCRGKEKRVIIKTGNAVSARERNGSHKLMPPEVDLTRKEVLFLRKLHPGHRIRVSGFKKRRNLRLARRQHLKHILALKGGFCFVVKLLSS
ncbi:hypothetical protein CEXT_343621 [Caerostris extrusa]|uniref:Uncharacterized protein n=1 Tax=Caerostris extrusa TaxID=172846 RepID=A0AAV4XPG6_CAEEX|nr:hypothetical protein CEXT_343621 [Caerostris extrusa]